MILYFNKPEKVRSTEEHNKKYMSNSGVAGTYVPNMSQEDAERWKAKYFGAKDRRIEIRKTIGFSKTESYPHVSWAQTLIVVREATKNSVPHVTISGNGKMAFSKDDWQEFEQVIEEAKMILSFSPKDAKLYINGELA
jgi:hypothetical protein